MTKIALDDPTSLSNEEEFLSVIAENNTEIEEASDLFLSRDGTEPNTMLADLDMNSNRITNLPEPLAGSEPATKTYVDDSVNLADPAALTAAVTAAAASASSASASATAAAASVASFTATSTDALTPNTGSEAFTIQAGKGFTAGMPVLIRSDANPTTVWWFGLVTTYVGTTLTVDVQAIGTASLAADWTIIASGIRGATGATGAAGADYTADAELAALSALTDTVGVLTQTAADTFTTRVLTGTANLITVTDGDGAAGNPTFTVGDNVVRRDAAGNALTVGYKHTPYDHGNLSGVTGITPNPSLGAFQTCTLAAASDITITAPSTESGSCVLQMTNTGAPTSVTFTGFDKTFAGDTFSLTINKVHWIYIYAIGANSAMLIKNIA